MIFMRHRPEGWSHGLGFLRERKSRVSAREEKSGSGLVLVDGRILTRSTRHTNNRYIVVIPFGYRNGRGVGCRWTFDSVGASGEPPNTSIVAVVAKEQFHFTQTILRRDRRIRAVRVHNRTALQAVKNFLFFFRKKSHCLERCPIMYLDGSDARITPQYRLCEMKLLFRYHSHN